MKIIYTYITFLLLSIFDLHGTTIQFIPNKGQWQGTFDFKANIKPGHSVFFEKHSMVFLLSDFSQTEDRYHKEPEPRYNDSLNSFVSKVIKH